MGRNIKFKRFNNSMIQRGITFITLMFIMLSFVNSVTLYTNQNDNYAYYISNTMGNKIYYDLVGSVNDVIYALNTSNITSDFQIEIPQTSNDFFLTITNNYANISGEIHFRGDLNKNPFVYTQPFTMSETGDYIFRIKNDYTDEPIKVYIDINNNTFTGSVTYEEIKPQTFNEVIGNLVTIFIDFAELNLKGWEITFYIIMFIITITFIIGLFGLSFYLIKYVKKLREGNL